MIKSPLRYPGGKSRAVKWILPYISPSFSEYREPMVGGGSVFLTITQLKEAFYTISDLNPYLIAFWKTLQENPDEFITQIKKTIKTTKNGRRLYYELKDQKNLENDFDIAVRFYILNRITFSGLVDSGGYSQEAFEKRFTHSTIKKLEKVAPLLKGVDIEWGDYSKILSYDGDDVFIYLDPPYYSASESKLYGNQGDLHTYFDHEHLAKMLKKSKFNWLVTYDDSSKIRELYQFANKYKYRFRYGMTSINGNINNDNELIITNYDCALKYLFKVDSEEIKLDSGL